MARHDEIRGALRRLLEEHGADMASVSRAIGRNHAYIQQYMTRGVPAELGYKTALALAEYFACSPALFGIAAQVTQDEHRLLMRYRRLPPLERRAVDRLIRSLGKEPA